MPFRRTRYCVVLYINTKSLLVDNNHIKVKSKQSNWIPNYPVVEQARLYEDVFSGAGT